MQSFEKLPAELRALKQWCLWKYVDVGGEKPTKVPFQPNGEKTSVTDPLSWCTFEQVVRTFYNGGFDGIGFVFSEHDPYAFVDLDHTDNPEYAARQLRIFNEFNSYSERSPSGKGLHIIVKGAIPKGRRRDSIEVYSSERYATMTGDVFNSHSFIVDRNDLLNQLFSQMGGLPTIQTYNGNDPEREDDATIIKRAAEATNGERFLALHRGEFQGLYPSQSEADFAYVDIIAFYTQNREQIIRIFRASPLGQRNKARRDDYVKSMVNRAFDRLTPQIDVDGFRIALEEKLSEKKNGEVYANSTSSNISINNNSSHSSSGISNPLLTQTTIPLPPGLMGEIARFIYDAAPRPVPEIAIAGAIGLMAGICGRSYNVSGTGLNQYILLLAKTGRGKEAISSGIDKIMNEVKKTVPVANEFIGPEIINSGQALTKYISNTSNCFISVIGEFGFTIDRISRPDANASDKMLYANLLSLYSRSGYGQVFKASIYSKKEDSVGATEAPSVSILGESNPTTFYEAVDDNMIAAGLLPRFITIEYEGNRKYFNQASIDAMPDPNMIDKIGTLAAHCKEIAHRKNIVNIEFDDEAKAILKKYDKETTDIINSVQNPSIDELWNRAHLKVLKLASLVAIGINPYNPIITRTEIEWARPIVEHSIKSFAHKFDAGEVGKASHEIKQAQELKRMIKKFIEDDWEKLRSYCSDQRMYSNKVIPYAYLNKRLVGLAAFQKDRLGATNAIKRVIINFLDSGFIAEVPRKTMIDNYGINQKAYCVTSAKWLL